MGHEDDQQPKPAPARRRGFDVRGEPPKPSDRMDAMESALASIVKHMETIGHEVGALQGVVTKVVRGEPVDEIHQVHPERDKVWACYNCGNRLGVYDTTEDVMRVRYREVYLWFHAGPGGYIKTVCRSCMAENRVDDQR